MTQEEDVCVVCLAKLSDEPDINYFGDNRLEGVSQLVCGHQFHHHCLTDWMTFTENGDWQVHCPLCKLPTRTVDVVYIPIDIVDAIDVSSDEDTCSVCTTCSSRKSGSVATVGNAAV